MDPRLLDYYKKELQYIREMGVEFAREYPKIAKRLALEGPDECPDPYVERLLEGFAFLAARIQLKIDSEFPRFTRHLFEMVYPDFLAPVPSMTMVQFQPDLSEGSLAEGFSLPRHTVLRSPLAKGEQTPCEYRTAHEVVLWPLEIVDAEYFTHGRDLPEIGLREGREIKAGIRLRLQTTAGLTFDKLDLDRLPLFLRGGGEFAMGLYELLSGHALATLVRPTSPEKGSDPWGRPILADPIRRPGFADEESLLPASARYFQGYRLLQEYFAFPSRYLFVELNGLKRELRRCGSDQVDVFVLLGRANGALQNAIDAGNFGLFCTPAVNLFHRRADRIHLDDRTSDYHVVPDRTRPMDFEVYQVTGVTGHGSGGEQREFQPFYAATDRGGADPDSAYFMVDRVPRVLSSKQRKYGARSSYVGSEVFVSLVDGEQAPYSPDLRQLELATLCTNRDLPLHMPVGTGRTDFNLEASAPVETVRCVVPPSRPTASRAERETAWRLVSHLSLNYLSLGDENGRGATSLREMLLLYVQQNDDAKKKEIEGLRSVAARPVVRRLPIDGPISFGRGLEVSLEFDDSAFEGTGVFLLGSVLEQFMRRYVSINSFTETVIRTIQRGAIKRWPVRRGRRQRL